MLCNQNPLQGVALKMSVYPAGGTMVGRGWVAVLTRILLRGHCCSKSTVKGGLAQFTYSKLTAFNFTF